MPRPQRKRTIYQIPECRTFTADHARGTVDVTLDEWEAIRLMDQEGLDQSECARRLNVARTTAQNIIRSAHAKIADALVNGRTIQIGGGNVDYSDDREFGCCRWDMESVQRIGGLTDQMEAKQMRIAVTYENETGEIFQHFGRTEYFKVYDVEDHAVKSSQVVSTNGQGHGALAGVLNGLNADVLICGGIGGGAQMALSIRKMSAVITMASIMRAVVRMKPEPAVTDAIINWHCKKLFLVVQVLNILISPYLK